MDAIYGEYYLLRPEALVSHAQGMVNVNWVEDNEPSECSSGCAGLCRLSADVGVRIRLSGGECENCSCCQSSRGCTVTVQTFNMGLEAGLRNACYRYDMHAKPAAD
jgi:hypothetical protein